MLALRKLTWIELKLFAREPFSLVFTLALPIVVLVVLIGTFKPTDPSFSGHHPSSYFLASYIGVVIGAIGLVALPVHLAGYRERGVLRRFRASSIPMWSVFGSQLLAGLAMAAVGAIVLVIVAALLYGAAPPPSLMCAGMRQVSALMPLTFAVRAIQQPWLGAHPKPLDLLLLGGLLIAAAAMSARVLRSS
jgi:ABC-2 type transport system permease protein